MPGKSNFSRAKIASMNTSKSRLRIVFMGSPEFALPSLRALVQNYKLVGVVTQPDRPSGRGRKLQAPPVKIMAQSFAIPFIQPKRLKEESAINQLKDWAPDVIVVAAFGQILRKNVLSLPKHGCINVHASLLPRWRGAAPIQAAILAGDDQSGITIMQMDEGLDTGPILSQKAIPISASESAATLSEKLSSLGAELLNDTLPAYIAGEIRPKKQVDAGFSYAPMLKKSDGELDVYQSAEFLARKVRAFSPWPGTFIKLNEQLVKIHKAQALTATPTAPGQLTIKDDLPAIGTADGWLLLEELQPSGKKPMRGEDYLRGGRRWEGMLTIVSSKEKT